MFYADHRKHGLRHSPFKALVAPRPIAWVSSLSTEGVVNLAPYSFFNAMADSPPIIVFAPNNPRLGGGRKDTLENIEQTGEFVVNLCNWDLRLPMNESSAHVPPEVDEIELAGLTAAPSEIVRPPRVVEAPAALECEFLFRVRLPGSSPKIENNACFGRVVGVHISDDIIVDGMVDMSRYRPIARCGYMDYALVESVFSMDRPDDNLEASEARRRQEAAE